MIQLFQLSPLCFYSLIIILGLCIGSFLNVVIYRLPIIMEQQWRIECSEFLNLSAVDSKQINLAFPLSFCPHCQSALRFRDNIPVISYLLLKGKCAHCLHNISLQYPLTELICTGLSIIIAYHFGINWQTVAGLIFTWLAISMAGIDIKHQLLPDILTYCGIWIGLFISLFGLFTIPQAAILGGLSGYLSLWIVAKLFKLITKKEGMGYGDFKLFAMLGTWFGWQFLPLIILIASALGALIGIAAIILKKTSRDTPIPFGPFLVFSGWVIMLWGQQISIITKIF